MVNGRGEARRAGSRARARGRLLELCGAYRDVRRVTTLWRRLNVTLRDGRSGRGEAVEDEAGTISHFGFPVACLQRAKKMYRMKREQRHTD
jgi:hypothetical protein